MKRLPLIPTVLVGLAVAAMIGLGLWQLLDRRPAKQALLARLADNPSKPPISFPRPGVDPEPLLFRRTSAYCLQPVAWTRVGGASVDGTTGYRQIAQCRTGAEGPGFSVDLGVAVDPRAQATWRGGEVTGWLTHAPDSTSMIGRLFGRGGTPGLMIVADRPAPGLKPSRPPSPQSISNNHLAYAVQWFLFAAAAGVIYLLALRRRHDTPPTAAAPPPPPSPEA